MNACEQKIRGYRGRASLVLAAALLTPGCGGDGRYDIERLAEGIACRLDTRTGDVICFDRLGHRTILPGGESPEEIPEVDLARLEFHVTRIDDASSRDDLVVRKELRAVIYNPTEWRLKNLRIDVRGEKPDSARIYSAAVDIGAERIGTFSVVVLPPKPADPPPASVFDDLLEDPLDAFGPVVKASLVSASGTRE